MVLLVLALIAVVGAEFSYSMRLEASAVRAYKNGIIGNHLAETALEQAIREIVADAPLVAEDDDGLLTFYTVDRRALPRLRRAKAELLGGQYSYRITDEEALLNINTSAPDRIDRLLATLGDRQGSPRHDRRLDPGLARSERRAPRQRRRERRLLPEARRYRIGRTTRTSSRSPSCCRSRGSRRPSTTAARTIRGWPVSSPCAARAP